MQTEFKVATDKKEKIKLDSVILSAKWIPTVGFGGSMAAIEVATAFVAEGSAIEIKGKSSKGKAPESIKGNIYNNRFDGKILIPEKVTVGEDLYFEAKLPKHGLKMESNAIPARPPILVKKMQWDRSVVKRKEVVNLTCMFEDGAEDGDEAIVNIYEHNSDTFDARIVSIPVTVEKSRVELQWEFDFTDKTTRICTDDEKKRVEKRYVQPSYYFTVVLHKIVIGENRESGLMKFTDSSNFTIYLADGTPLANQSFALKLPDGTEKTGTLDDDGCGKIDSIPPGPFVVECVFKK